MASTALKVALVQCCATADVAANLTRLQSLVAEAAATGATLVALPEAFAFIGPERDKQRILEPLEATAPGPILACCQALAREHGIELLLGGFHEQLPDDHRAGNTSVLLDASGAIISCYRKIHLFDVDLADGTRLMESRGTAPGERAVIVERDWGTLALTICYDLRFPALYQALVNQGAAVITVPSAFTHSTGTAHWHALLRARAIETQCFVLAPAQHGRHNDRRRSFGHSLIIDPWGEILAEGPAEGDAVISATLDLAQVSKVRAQMPVQDHRRPFS